MTIQGRNHKTGERVEVQLLPRDSNSNISTIQAECFDKDGTLRYRLEGSWFDKIDLKDASTGQSQNIWTENLELIPDHNKQFNYTQYGLIMNYLSEEMRRGGIAPTDSRFQMDQRPFGEGKVDEADEAKVAIEPKWRNANK